MEKAEILSKLKELISEEKIKQDEPMEKHTSFKIGGPADFFVKISSIDELKNILLFTKNINIPLTIIGNGTNLLVSDKGIRGIVIKLDLREIKLNKSDNDEFEIIADSGVQIGFLAQKLLKEEISGFEELSGIPGTIGGAILMNAGAHGKEIKNVVKEITVMDYDGNIHKFKNEESKFSYRNSMYSDGKYIILQAKFILQTGNYEEIKQKMDEYAKYRKEKQPIEFSSAGSTFKRGNDFITAQLIDQAGLKGYSIGGAKISEKHAGFIINTGNATAKDVLDLAKYVKEKIYEKFQKDIELEIKIIGE